MELDIFPEPLPFPPFLSSVLLSTAWMLLLLAPEAVGVHRREKCEGESRRTFSGAVTWEPRLLTSQVQVQYNHLAGGGNGILHSLWGFGLRDLWRGAPPARLPFPPRSRVNDVVSLVWEFATSYS